jgi:hypothetical protein
MLMAAAKFQWEDPAAGLLGGGQSKSGRDQADLPDQSTRRFFYRELDSANAENRIVEVERKPLR